MHGIQTIKIYLTLIVRFTVCDLWWDAVGTPRMVSGGMTERR
jgi:hypothetical protein